MYCTVCFSNILFLFVKIDVSIECIGGFSRYMVSL